MVKMAYGGEQESPCARGKGKFTHRGSLLGKRVGLNENRVLTCQTSKLNSTLTGKGLGSGRNEGKWDSIRDGLDPEKGREPQIRKGKLKRARCGG